MSELLLIDDDRELCELLGTWLVQEGFSVRASHDGAQARRALAEQTPDAVVLDVMLPDGSGLELLKQLRGDHPDLPVLMLSARGEPLDRILGLELGADDYLAKPCDPRELTARLRAVLRRTHPAQPSAQMQLGDLSLNLTRGVAQIDGQEISLTLSESRILEALLRQPGEPLDKQALAQLALGRKLTLYDRSLDMHVSNLRKKLGRQPAHPRPARPRLLLQPLSGFRQPADTRSLPKLYPGLTALDLDLPRLGSSGKWPDPERRNTMRKTLTALFIAAALPTFAMAAPAANDLPPPPMEGGHMMGQHGPRHGGPMKELDLTREQRQQMGKLMGEQMKARHEITQRYLAKLPAAEQKALKDELKASHEKTQKDIRALLTPEQQKKFDELQKKREQRKAEWAEFQQWKADKKSN